MNDISETTNNAALEIIKNKANWQIAVGELARHVSEADFANMSNLTGITIADGVSAIIYVNDEEVAQLSGGTYNFLSNKEINDIIKKNEPAPGRSSLGTMWHALVKFFSAKKRHEDKEREKTEEEKKKRPHTTEEVIKDFNERSRLSVYLKVDRPFPVCFGYAPDQVKTALERDLKSETEFSFRTRNIDAKVGITLMLCITDFKEFIRGYMVGRKSVTCNDIRQSIESKVRSIVRNELRDTVVSERGIEDANVLPHIETELKQLARYMPGVSVTGVVDISCNSSEMDRYWELSKEMYCNERELDYLRRTNEYMNRLAVETTAQDVDKAKNEEERTRLLDEVNKDHLLNEEEMRRFRTTLNLQSETFDTDIELKRLDTLVVNTHRRLEIEETLNREELRSRNIRLKDQHNFDIEAFKASVKHEQEMVDTQLDHTANIDEATFRAEERQTSTNIGRLGLEEKETVAKIEQAASIDEATFRAEQRRAATDAGRLTIEEQLYGQQYAARRQHLLDDMALNDITREYEQKKALEDIEHSIALMRKEMDGMRAKEDYDYAIRRRRMDLEDEIKKHEWDLQRRKEEMELDLIAARRDVEIETKKKQWAAELEMATQKTDAELSDAVRRGNAELDLEERKGNMALDLEDRKNRIEHSKDKDDLEILKAKQAMSLDAMERLAMLRDRKSDTEHRHTMEEKELDHKREIDRMKLENERNALDQDTAIRMAREEAGMTPEQLFVRNMAKGGGGAISEKAVEEYAKSYSINKESEVEKEKARLAQDAAARAESEARRQAEAAEQAARDKERFLEKMFASREDHDREKDQATKDLYKEMLGMMGAMRDGMGGNRGNDQASREKDELYRQMIAMQQSNMNSIMNFSQNAMQTNAGVVRDATQGHNERQEAQMQSVERIATQRIDDVNRMKEEYREQMKLQQDRVDKNQDMALDYTTRDGAARQPVRYCPNCGAEVSPTGKFCGECGTKLKN